MIEKEIYVLCRERSKETALAFLDYFAPKRVSDIDEFDFPPFSEEPEHSFASVDDAMAFVEAFPRSECSFYWTNTGASKQTNRQVMLFYLADGGLIAGVVCREGKEIESLREVTRVVQGSYGYVTEESRPPDTIEEFVAECGLGHEFAIWGEPSSQ